VATWLPHSKKIPRVTPSVPIAALARKCAAAHKLDAALVCAVTEQESSWNPFAINATSRPSSPNTSAQGRTSQVAKERDAALKAARGGRLLRRIGRAAKWFAHRPRRQIRPPLSGPPGNCGLNQIPLLHRALHGSEAGAPPPPRLASTSISQRPTPTRRCVHEGTAREKPNSESGHK